MRGPGVMHRPLFTCARLEDFVPRDRPVRPIQRMINEAFIRLAARSNEIYADGGRSSIPPEELFGALLLMMLYWACRESMVVVQLHCNLLFRWCVGLSIDDAVWDYWSFSINRERLVYHAAVEMNNEGGSGDGRVTSGWC